MVDRRTTCGAPTLRRQRSAHVSLSARLADTLATPGTRWIPAIDGWRALAVAAVVLHHTNGAKLGGWAIGNLGVAVFFSISGFLAYYVLWRDEKKLGHISYSYFLQRRVLRIWPAYFVVIAVAYLIASQAAVPRADDFSGLLTFTVNIEMMLGHPWPIAALTPLWTIAVEEQFYIVAPLMYLALRSRYALVFCGAVLLLSNLARVAYIWSYSGPPGNLGLYYAFYTYADTFLLGAVLARFYLEGWRPSRAVQMWAAIFIVPVFVFVAGAWGTSLFPPYPAFAAVAYAIVSVAGVLAVLTALGNNLSVAFLSSPPLRIVGILSYSIYMVHVGALDMASKVMKAWDANVFASNLVTVAITLALAAVLYLIIERPALVLKRKLPPAAVGPFPAIVTIGAVSTGMAIIIGRSL